MRKKNSITIAEIAKKAGVSRTTVSFYLNGKFEKMSPKTRERIRDVIEETEFVPNALARSLNNKQSHLIGLFDRGREPKDARTPASCRAFRRRCRLPAIRF